MIRFAPRPLIILLTTLMLFSSAAHPVMATRMLTLQTGMDKPGIDVAGMDRSVNPADDFYTYANGAWMATPPPIVPRSTVGAGDSSLAGYLIAQSTGAAPADCLRSAVAYGAAAASLAGTQAPTPDHLDLPGVRVTELSGAARMT